MLAAWPGTMPWASTYAASAASAQSRGDDQAKVLGDVALAWREPRHAGPGSVGSELVEQLAAKIVDRVVARSPGWLVVLEASGELDRELERGRGDRRERLGALPDELALAQVLVVSFGLVAWLGLADGEHAAGFEALVVELAEQLEDPAEPVLIGRPARPAARAAAGVLASQQPLGGVSQLGRGLRVLVELLVVVAVVVHWPGPYATWLVADRPNRWISLGVSTFYAPRRRRDVAATAGDRRS